MNITSTTARTFSAITSNLPALEGKIAKINKKAVKHGLPTISLTYGEPYVEKMTFTTPMGEMTFDVEKVDVTFPSTEEFIAIDGWKVVGATITEDGVAMVHSFDGDDYEDYRGSCRCDHCGSNRKRNKVFFLKKRDRLILVGSTCIQDYTGISLAKMGCLTEMLSIINNGYDENGDRYIKPKKMYPIKTIIGLGLRLPYVSRQKAEERELQSTINAVKGIIDDPRDGAVSDEELEKAQTIIDWFESTEKNSSYLKNCQEIMNLGFVAYNKIGYVVGLIGCKAFEDRKLEMEASKPESVHVGVIGKRSSFVGTVKSIKHFMTAWGNSCITTLSTPEGGVLVYFNTVNIKDGSSKRPAEEGETVRFDAMVKTHSEFNGVNQTVLSRATKGQLA